MLIRRYGIKIKYLSLCLAVATALLGLSLNSDYVAAESCKPVHVVFARGSGSNLGSGEAQRMAEQLKLRISQSLYSFYELGSQKINNYQYPAVEVSDWRSGNALGAKVTSGYGNDYGKSVDQGVGELRAYLANTLSACPQTQFILGGYSQGAHVIGQAVQGQPEDILSHITYIGLFGDPKLYLPEGKGIFAPACRGKDFSHWRRDIGDCNTDKGSLNAHIPYLPTSLEKSTGLWCASHDFICGSSPYIWDQSGHQTYKNDKGAIDKAVLEAMQKLKSANNPYIDTTSIKTTVNLKASTSTSTSSLDVVFIIDTTGSMSGQINAAKSLAQSLANTVRTSGGRVALVEYKDLNDSITAEVRAPLTANESIFSTAIQTLSADGGGDEPEATLHALMTAFNTLKWQDGATKAAVVLTDAPYHDPDLVDGTTTAAIIKRSLEIDPVNIYVVGPTSLESRGSYTTLVNGTAGQFVSDSGDTEASLMTAITKIVDRPVIFLENTSYYGLPGESFRFALDPYRSYVENATIEKYDWDFNGDGVFDKTTHEPEVIYTYPGEFTGNMQVRATASNGLIASSSATITATTIPSAKWQLPSPPTNLRQKVVDSNSIEVTWDPSIDPAADNWILSQEGVIVGKLDKSRATITVTDLEMDRPITFGIASMTSDERVGEFSKTDLLISRRSDTQQPSQTNSTNSTIRPSTTAPQVSSFLPNRSAPSSLFADNQPTPTQTSSLPTKSFEVETTKQDTGKPSSTNTKVSTLSKSAPLLWPVAFGAVLAIGLALATKRFIRK